MSPGALCLELYKTPLRCCRVNETFQSDHAATRGLLDEERTRYERCRASLETSQEHLADLNERFNELRAEVEVITFVGGEVGIRHYQ